MRNFFFLDDSIFSPAFLQRVASERGARNILQKGKVNSLDASGPDSPSASQTQLSCSTTVLLLVFHAGSVLGILLLHTPILFLINFVSQMPT